MPKWDRTDIRKSVLRCCQRFCETNISMKLIPYLQSKINQIRLYQVTVDEILVPKNMVIYRMLCYYQAWQSMLAEGSADHESNKIRLKTKKSFLIRLYFQLKSFKRNFPKNISTMKQNFVKLSHCSSCEKYNLFLWM